MRPSPPAGGVIFSALSHRKRRLENYGNDCWNPVLGCGTVGSSVAERLLREQPVLERRSGVRYRVCGIAILDRHKPRAAAVERRLLTLDAASLVDDPGVDLVIEVIGGVAKAAELVERALYRGRHVVTANKELLATHGPRLQALAAAGGAALRCEGAVAGAVPILRTLDEALAGDQILRWRAW